MNVDLSGGMEMKAIGREEVSQWRVQGFGSVIYAYFEVTKNQSKSSAGDSSEPGNPIFRSKRE